MLKSLAVNKIGVLLPQPYRGGSLRFAKKLCEMVLSLTNSETHVVLSIVKGQYDVPHEFAQLLKDSRFSIRETVWEIVPRQQLSKITQLQPQTNCIEPEEVSYPDDGGQTLLDCSYWLMVSDRTMAPLAVLRPFAIFPLDFIQRYVPEIFGKSDEYLWKVHLESFQRNIRNASLVVCTTPATSEDAISFAGVPKRRVRTMLPFLEDYPSAYYSGTSGVDNRISQFQKKPYFVWPTNPHPHKNHLNALNCLKQYYDSGGGLNCVITGPSTEVLRAGAKEYSDYATEVREAFLQLFNGDDRVSIAGVLPEEQYWHLLKGAAFVWHNVIKDNGTFSVIEAALANVPSLSSDYSQIRFFDELFGLGLTYFSAMDPAQGAEKLREMESRTTGGKHSAPVSISFPLDYHHRMYAELKAILDELGEVAACRN
jgi:glycosyltransferase involved in cell wall biosynthesis